MTIFWDLFFKISAFSADHFRLLMINLLLKSKVLLKLNLNYALTVATQSCTVDKISAYEALVDYAETVFGGRNRKKSVNAI